MEKIDKIIFNSPLESGLRVLFIINESRNAMDTQRIVYYNYILLHSSDVKDSPASLHPALPNRSCEVLVNRKIVLGGLSLLLSKGLVRVLYSKSGVRYSSCKGTEFFLSHFESAYAVALKERAKWVVSKFGGMSDAKLDSFMNENLGKWGSEFSTEYGLGDE